MYCFAMRNIQCLNPFTSPLRLLGRSWCRECSNSYFAEAMSPMSPANASFYAGADRISPELRAVSSPAGPTC